MIELDGLPKENLWKIEVCETPKKSGEVLGKLKRLKDRYKTIRNPLESKEN